MVFFDLLKLEDLAGSDTTKFITLLGYHCRGIKVVKKKERYKPANLVGSSFLLNPAPIFKNAANINHNVQYVRLAGRRDYTLYKFYGIAYLDLSFFPDIDIQKIKHNPLISIENNKVYFLYEQQYLKGLKNGIKV